MLLLLKPPGLLYSLTIALTVMMMILHRRSEHSEGQIGVKGAVTTIPEDEQHIVHSII